MSRLEVVLAITNVGLATLFYFLGLHLGRRERSEDLREIRIQRVVDSYKANRRDVAELSGLLKAGAPGLKSDSEVREACDRIVAMNESYPIQPKILEHIGDCDLLHFLKELNKNSVALRHSQSLIEFAVEFKRKHGKKNC